MNLYLVECPFSSRHNSLDVDSQYAAAENDSVRLKLATISLFFTWLHNTYVSVAQAAHDHNEDDDDSPRNHPRGSVITPGHPWDQMRKASD